MDENKEILEWAELARQLSLDAGRLAMEQFGLSSSQLKADDSIVTSTDHALQQLILDGIAARYPRHAVIAEETMTRPRQPSASVCWVIDPLDGTRNFASGVTIFGISIAVLLHGHPVAGVIHVPMGGQTFHAVAGRGLTVNGKPHRPGSVCLPDHDVVIAVAVGRNKPVCPAIKAWADRYVIRNFGCTSLHLALVATGALDAAFSQDCKLWDIAAGALMVKETGGCLTDSGGRECFPVNVATYEAANTPFLAGKPEIHAVMLRDLLAK